MADFAVPNLFQDRGGANVPAAIESGFGMGLRKQDMNMRKQSFANEMSDREEMRNAMTKYGQAQDEGARQAALSEVGVVSPDARAKLENAWVNANESQRKAMMSINNDAGSAAYMALQEQDPSARQKIWDAYRGRLPENARRALPDTVDDLSLKAVMAQSSDAMDTMRKLTEIKATGEKQKDVAEYQGSINYGLEDRKHGNRMTETEREAELRRSLEDKKMLNAMTTKAAFPKGGSSSIRPADALKMIESDDAAIAAKGRSALVGDSEPPKSQYTYIPGKGLVPNK